jgi:hypothetical protein
MVTHKKKAPVTMAAIRQRLRRRLQKEGSHGHVLKVNRRESDGNLGEFYLVDIGRNYIIDTDVDVLALARKTGVLKSYEEVVKERK